MVDRDSRVVKLDQEAFRPFLSARPFALVRVGGLDLEIPKELVSYIEAEHPGIVVYGSVDRSTIPMEVWWEKHFGKATWPHERDGFYLFHKSKLVGKAPSGEQEPPAELAHAVLQAAVALTALAVAPGAALHMHHQRAVDAVARFVDGSISRLHTPQN